MKEFLAAFLTIFLVGILSEKITDLIGFQYRVFSDEFNLWLLLADLGIFVALFIPIFALFKRLIVR
ncbi:hypothetical protein FZC84_10670 [Rossellomorea vietnamensis]|uniref:Uncharacterized protein n=1 Tax=Rossellomorea vietnamensis TaxID=218284 RepID=A0A5D4MCJ7_9BACI|nr:MULTISPECIES: hypothetical protein [Bacillaceae]TYR99218.1 hypothetical protein FZC84_10670 [Rossellomorea vietnamensis]